MVKTFFTEDVPDARSIDIQGQEEDQGNTVQSTVYLALTFPCLIHKDVEKIC